MVENVSNWDVTVHKHFAKGFKTWVVGLIEDFVMMVIAYTHIFWIACDVNYLKFDSFSSEIEMS